MINRALIIHQLVLNMSRDNQPTVDQLWHGYFSIYDADVYTYD